MPASARRGDLRYPGAGESVQLGQRELKRVSSEKGADYSAAARHFQAAIGRGQPPPPPPPPPDAVLGPELALHRGGGSDAQPPAPAAAPPTRADLGQPPESTRAAAVAPPPLPPPLHGGVTKKEAKAAAKLAAGRAKEKYKDGPMKKQLVFPAARAELKRGAAAVASFLAAVLTEICLCGVCSCHEILRRNSRGQGRHWSRTGTSQVPRPSSTP
jgi:hypothetical protein